MATGHIQPSISEACPDFVAAPRRSRILMPRQVGKIEVAVASGRYPRHPVDLASMLVRQGQVTQYQARCLLHGKQSALIVDRYVILDRLGQGGMGRVYKARHQLMGRLVAIKFIAAEYLARKHALPRFLREMRLVSRLDHPAIVRALDAGQLSGTPFIVMEYVPGVTLDRLLESHGPLPPG